MTDAGREQPLPPDGQLRLRKHELLRLASKLIGLRHSGTKSHCERVEELCWKAATAVGLSLPEADDLLDAALVHDIGKIAFSDPMFKEADLDSEMLKQRDQHPLDGEKALRDSTSLPATVVEIVKYHHYKLDGSGYPQGSPDPQVRTAVNLIVVADSYDAMTRPREYRWLRERRWFLSEVEAVAELQKSASSGKLDKEIVEAFVRAAVS